MAQTTEQNKSRLKNLINQLGDIDVDFVPHNNSAPYIKNFTDYNEAICEIDFQGNHCDIYF